MFHRPKSFKTPHTLKRRCFLLFTCPFSFKMSQKWQYVQCSDQECIPPGCLACHKGLSLNTIQQVCSRPQFLMLISLMFKQRHNSPHWDSASSNAMFCMHKNMLQAWERFLENIWNTAYFLLKIVNIQGVSRLLDEGMRLLTGVF